MKSVEEINQSMRGFGLVDYGVFTVMLICCSCVGLYFGYQDHMKHKRASRNRRGSIIEVEAIDYLMGGRNMKVFPVAMSLVASFVSGITLLGNSPFHSRLSASQKKNNFSSFLLSCVHEGTSTEIYLYGTQYCFILFAVIISALIMHYTLIPTFHELQITSTYEVMSSQQQQHRRRYFFIFIF